MESPKPKLRSKKNTPIKEALKNASGKNTPNKTRLAKEKETPKKSTTGSSSAEINYIDLSDDDEDFGEPIVKPEPVLQAPAASKPLAPSNLTQPKIQSTFLKSSKAETRPRPLTSKASDSPKLKDVKRASGRKRKWEFWYFYFNIDTYIDLQLLSWTVINSFKLRFLLYDLLSLSSPTFALSSQNS